MQKKATKTKNTTGMKHGGTIVLNDGTSFTQKDLKKDPGKVMASIIKQQRSLYAKNIEDWQVARAAADQPEYPMRVYLYDIYLDAILDAFIHGQIYNHRVLPVKNKAFSIFGADKKPNPDKTALFKKGWVDDLFTWWMESKFWGKSVPYIDEVEFDGTTTWIKKLVLIPRKHVHPEAHIITHYQTDLEGIDYTTDPVCKYVLPAGNDYDLGLLNKAVPLWILKKHSWQNWDEFEEIFGMPIRIAKTASQDPRVQSEIENWLSQMGTAAYGIFPDGTDMEIIESKQSDSFKVFSEKIRNCNEELAILFCGQTMTSMNGSSRSQGEVHERVMQEITQDDEMFIETLFNETLIPLLRDVHMWPLDPGDYFQWEQPEDLTALLAIYQGVNAMGFQLDPKEVADRFKVKIIGIKAPTPSPPPAKDPNAPPPAKEIGDDEQLKADSKAILKLHADIMELYTGGPGNV
jgi:hypothetical protein